MFARPTRGGDGRAPRAVTPAVIRGRLERCRTEQRTIVTIHDALAADGHRAQTSGIGQFVDGGPGVHAHTARDLLHLQHCISHSPHTYRFSRWRLVRLWRLCEVVDPDLIDRSGKEVGHARLAAEDQVSTGP